LYRINIDIGTKSLYVNELYEFSDPVQGGAGSCTERSGLQDTQAEQLKKKKLLYLSSKRIEM